MFTPTEAAEQETTKANICQGYNNVIPGNNTTYERNQIYPFIDARMVKSLHGKL
jgi:hypothetical protein